MKADPVFVVIVGAGVFRSRSRSTSHCAGEQQPPERQASAPELRCFQNIAPWRPSWRCVAGPTAPRRSSGLALIVVLEQSTASFRSVSIQCPHRPRRAVKATLQARHDRASPPAATGLPANCDHGEELAQESTSAGFTSSPSVLASRRRASRVAASLDCSGCGPSVVLLAERVE